MSDSKNENAWTALFAKYDIDAVIKNTGQHRITAKEINEFREARLMTKFDHRFQLPKILRDKQLSILPISRGAYVLSRMETFERFTESSTLPIVDLALPSHIESIDFSTITSEALAINAAYISQIISDFTEDEKLVPTISGRMSSRTFNFKIQQIGCQSAFLDINVENAQVEIDGGYEGLHSLNLIEAKNNLSSDFLIRQLYYPYRLWQGRIQKMVRPIFLTYTNGIFHLREYEFSDLLNYNSITLKKEKKYRIKDTSEQVINIETIQCLLHTIPTVIESPDVPFPQADSFERIINLCEILYNNIDESYTKEVLSCSYDFKDRDSFDMRQVDYYTNAAIYLGLVQKDDSQDKLVFELTEKGFSLFKTGSIVKRQLEFIKAILSHQVFKKTLALYLKKAEEPTKNEIVAIMKESNIQNVTSESTFQRRAATVLAWCNWILGMREDE